METTRKQKKRPSDWQVDAWKIVKQYYPNIPDPEYPITVQDEKNPARWLDIAIPDLGIDIEMDGDYWHLDEEEDAKRDELVAKEGWEVIRFGYGSSLEELESMMENLSSGHSGGKSLKRSWSAESIEKALEEVEKIEKKKTRKLVTVE